MKVLFGNFSFNEIIFQKKTITLKLFQSHVNDLVCYLHANKQSDSPFVFLYAKNHYKTTVAYFSIIKLNKICVLVDPEIKSLELKEIMEVTPPAFEIKIIDDDIIFDYDKEVQINKTFFNKQDLTELEDVCTIVYSNAEDGFAKASMITRNNLEAMINSCQTLEIFTKERVVCALAPFSHLFGLVNGFIVPAHAPCSIYIYDINDIFSLEQFAMDVKEYNITNIYTIPIIYYLLSRTSNPKDLLSSLKSCTSGGIKLAKDIAELFFLKTGKKVKEGYGLTEASPVCTWHHYNSEIILGSVGQALPCCKVKIKNSLECKTGEIGEVCIRGKNVMKAYYKNKAATEKVIINDWLHTGDLGKLDNNGYLYITGIKKRMYNVGGKNVYPKEVERFISMNKNVKFIDLSSTNNEYFGNNIIADIELIEKSKDNEQEFKGWCKRNISNFKLPKKWNFLS